MTREKFIESIRDLDMYGTHLCDRPAYLFHYTSIEGLAHILKSKQIRFTPLTEKDDKLECMLDTLQYIRKYVFSSSWTDMERESIPFWSMYTKNMKGVRIKLPTYMFKDYVVTLTEDKLRGVKQESLMSMIPENKIYGDNYFITPVSIKDAFSLSKVRYNDENTVKNYLERIKKKGIIISFNDWGIIKTKDWEFQSEWRYRLLVFPVDYSLQNAHEDSGFRMLQGEDVSINEIFIDLNPHALSQMEILLGPKCDDADKIIIEALIKAYDIDATVKQSVLQIK